MARDTLAAARADLYGAISAAMASQVSYVYSYEPGPGDAIPAEFITVSTRGMAPDYFLVALRVYVSVGLGAQTAQETLDTLVMATDAAMPDWAGPSDWEVEWDERLGCFVATNILEIGREDY